MFDPARDQEVVLDAGELLCGEERRREMKTVSDGFSKPRPASEELPIDINYAKLADWLLDRQKIKADWRNALRHIQDKVSLFLVGNGDRCCSSLGGGGVTRTGVRSRRRELNGSRGT